MNPLDVIAKHYAGSPEAERFLVAHSGQVARKAIEISNRVWRLKPDIHFIEEAAVLHDIGILKTRAPMFGCRGEAPYICHGVLGREMLEAEGLPLHALVCERHVGVGLTIQDIKENGFPLPLRDMVPESLEEKIVCFADKFFSKYGNPLEEKPFEAVRAEIARYGNDKVAVFDLWAELLGEK